MREEEIREELELCARSFRSAREISEEKSIDNFDELKILEASFNRLFLCVEHLCNAVIMMETGNFSKKHFGDFAKLKSLEEKYKADFDGVYQTTYNFRSYGDYRKFPEIRERFNRSELKTQINAVRDIIKSCLILFSKHLDVKDIINKLEITSE